jgi:hypothetical protein
VSAELERIKPSRYISATCLEAGGLALAVDDQSEEVKLPGKAAILIAGITLE